MSCLKTESSPVFKCDSCVQGKGNLDSSGGAKERISLISVTATVRHDVDWA